MFLPVVVAGGHQMRVAGGEGLDQRRHVLGDAVRQHGVVGCQNLGDAVDCRRRRGDVAGGVSSDEDMDVAADFTGGGDGVQRGRSQLAVIMVCKDEDAHGQITFASFFSLFTRSDTSDTLIPASRAGGSSTRVMFSRGLISTPRSSADIESSGFFFAFMMFGSDA